MGKINNDKEAIVGNRNSFGVLGSTTCPQVTVTLKVTVTCVTCLAGEQESGGTQCAGKLEWGYNQRKKPMATTDLNQLSEDYRRIEQAIRYIEANAHAPTRFGRDRRELELERIPLPAPVHPLGRHQPQALPAIPDQGERQGSCSPAPPTCWMPLTKPAFPAPDGCTTCSSSAKRSPRASINRGRGHPDRLRLSPHSLRRMPAGAHRARHLFPGFRGRQTAPSALGQLKQDWANATLTEDPVRTAPVIDQIFARRPGTSLPLESLGASPCTCAAPTSRSKSGRRSCACHQDR